MFLLSETSGKIIYFFILRSKLELVPEKKISASLKYSTATAYESLP